MSIHFNVRNQIINVYREAQIMKNCDHPNLIKLYAVCTKEGMSLLCRYYKQLSYFQSPSISSVNS